MITFRDISLVLFVLSLALSLWNLIRRSIRNKNLPPGPRGVPLLGVLPWMRPSRAHLILSEWSKEYGPLFSFYIGTRLFVCLADVRLIKEALVKKADAFSGRPHLPINELTNKNHGLVMSDGPLFKEQRRFALSTLRDLGVGKPILENSIKEELDSLIEEIRGQEGQPKDYQMVLNNAVSNVICSLVFGKRFEYDDKKFLDLMNHLSVILSKNGQNIFSAPNFFSFIGLLMKLPFNNPVKSNILRMEQVEDFCMEMIREKENDFSADNEPEDYIDSFMQVKHAKKDGTYFYDFQLLHSVISLFAAGTETTSTTLRWALLFMAHNQGVQDRVREEISNLVGRNNLPDLKDRPKLPYTEAVIMESQRLANLAPLALPHRVVTEVELEGYTIPQDTLVVPLLWAVHRNPDLFPDPERFDPQRFLDEDNRQRRMDSLIPFSVGKRSCLGESLAKMELFLFFTALVQSFRFELPAGELVSTNYDSEHERMVGITSSPPNFNLKAISLT